MNHELVAGSRAGRNSRIELLRIFSMLLIVAFHATGFGYSEPDRPFIVQATAAVLGSWGIFAVDLFVIISAYFLVGQKFRSRRIIHLIFQVFTYIVLWCGLSFGYAYIKNGGVAAALRSVAAKLYDDMFDPFLCRRYWFATAYFFMLLASPFLNRLLQSADRRSIKKILIVFSFIPIFAQFQKSPVLDAASFFYIYLLTGAVKLHGGSAVERFAKPGYLALLFGAVLTGKFLLMHPDLPQFLQKLITYTIAATDRHSLIMLPTAMLFFFCALQKKPFYSSFVNRATENVFGVYLLTELYILDYYGIQEYVYKKLTWTGFITDGALFPIQFIAVTLLVFLAAFGVEYLRNLLLQKPFMRLAAKKGGAKLQKLDDWFNNED